MRKTVSFTVASESVDCLGIDRITGVDVLHAEHDQVLLRETEEQTNENIHVHERETSNYLRT